MTTGKIHAGKIEHSERHQRILRVLKDAEHPLSGEEISARVQTSIGKIPQAVSTTIGEMRSDENRADGYMVSYACIWRAAREGEAPGPRAGKDGGIIFVLSHAGEPWHDGRPRYWLQAAPGWSPEWSIGTNGEIRRLTPDASRLPEVKPCHATPDVLRCRLATCGKDLPPDVVNHGEWYCNDDCRTAARELMRPKKEEGALF